MKLNTNKQELEKLWERRRRSMGEIAVVDRTLRRLEKDERVAKLKKHVGLCYRDVESPASATFITYYFVIGISQDTMRNRVIKVNRNGRGKNAWYEIERNDEYSDMSKQQRISTIRFMKLYREAIRATDPHRIHS